MTENRFEENLKNDFDGNPEAIARNFAGTGGPKADSWWDDPVGGATYDEIMLDLTGADILFAEYTYESCEGSATVIYAKDGRLFEVSGFHCSCHGLERQWEPEEVSWAHLARRDWGDEPYAERIKSVIAQHTVAAS